MKSNISQITKDILLLTTEWEGILNGLTEEIVSNKRNKQNRTIKQLLGHLIDSASNNHQRIVRLQYNENLVFPDYTQDNDLWISIQSYETEDWKALIQLWKYFNLHLVHIIQEIDLTKLNNSWNDFEGRKVTLLDMIEGYPSHLHLHLSEIKELLSLRS